MEISLCMIIKNEEDTLEACLQSVYDVVDEIILVDTGSTDSSKQLAYKFTENVYDFEWTDDFSAARNFSFSLATKEYILVMDADEILIDIQKFKELKNNIPNGIDYVQLKRYMIDEKGIRVFNESINRIFRTDKNFQWTGRIHEYIPNLTENVLKTDIQIFHDKKKNSQERNLQILSKEFEAQNHTNAVIYFYAIELLNAGFLERGISMFELYFEKYGYNDFFGLESFRFLSRFYTTTMQIDKLTALIENCVPYWYKRSEFCTEVAKIMLEIHDEESNRYWLNRALACPRPKEEDAIYSHYYYYFNPNFHLGMSYFRDKSYDIALKYFETALTYDPPNSALQEIIQTLRKLCKTNHDSSTNVLDYNQN